MTTTDSRYSVSIANRLLNREDNTSPSLKGVIGGNGFLGPILEIADSSEFMYQVSMVNDTGRDAFSEKFKEMKAMAANETLAPLVPLVLSQTLFTSSPPTLFQNLTSYNDYLSPLYTERAPSMKACLMLLSMPGVKRAFHVGEDITFQYNNLQLLHSLAPDYLNNITLLVTNVLNKTEVLLYTGQLDLLFPSVNQRAYLAKLQWKESDEYRKAYRYPWKPSTWNDYQGYAGFLKQTTRFTDALILGMSHYGAAEKPDEIYHLMKEFITNSSAAAGKASQRN